MALPFGIWPIFIGFIWVAEALPTGGLGNSLQLGNPQQRAIGMAGNPPESDEILNINQELIPPEAPASSFLLEGDIIKASPFRVFSSASPKWPKRRGTVQIPYVISYKYDKPSVKIIKEAFADFARFTCIKFVPYSYQRDFISIMPMSGCFSSVGRTGGMQVVSLAPACLRRGKGVTLHELMHVVGFWHEHSRADRDKYIRISWNEILTGFEINFMKSWNSNMLVNYDYSSVMHYGRYAFSMTGLPTIIPLSNPYVALGQRWNLSRSDIARVNKLYKCSPTLTESESPTESPTQENIMDFLSNELEPCPTEGEIKVSTPSLTAGVSSPGTKPPETVQSARRPSRQMTSAPTAWTEEIMGKTAMDGEGLNVPLAEHPIMESETFEPMRMSTHGITYLEATGKPPLFHMEIGTVGPDGKPLIPTREASVLGTASIKEPDFTTVMAPPAWLSEETTHHRKAAEGLSTKIPTDALAGLAFPELVSPARVARVETGGTRPSDVGIAETTSIQGTELAYHPTYLVQKGPPPATELGVVTLSSEQTQSLESQTELATAEITSPSKSLGTYTAHLSLGPTPPEQVHATETPHPTSTEKWTRNLARLSDKYITTMALTRTRSALTWETPSVEMETRTMSYATEQTSLLPPVQNWTSSPTKQGNQSANSQAYSPGSHEQSTIAIPTSSITETEPTEVMQPTSLTTSAERVQNHTIYPVHQATTRHKGIALSLSEMETSYRAPLTKATTSVETQAELGFVEATKIKASYQDGSPSLTEGTRFPVTKVKDAEYVTEAETLPVNQGSQASEPAEIGMQATKTNYRNKERVHTNTLFPAGTSPTAIGPTYTTPSLEASENPITNPPNAGPAEATRSEARNKATLSTKSSPEMGAQEASNASPNGRRGLTYTPASVLTSSPATELKFMEHPTREVSSLETPLEAVNTPLLGMSETSTTHSILTWEPIAQVEYRKQMMTQFPKTSPLNAEHLTKIASLEATAESGLVETTGTGMEAKEHGSPAERTSPPLSEAPEVTFSLETSTTSSAEMSVQEAISTHRKRSRWASHTAHSIKRLSQATIEPTYVMVSEEPGNPTISADYQTAEVVSTNARNQQRLSVSSSRTGMGAQEFKDEPRRKGRRPSPTLPSVGRRERAPLLGTLKSKVMLLQGNRLRKGLFPLKQTQPFLGMKSTESVTTTEEAPLLTETWQLHQAQTGPNVPAMLSPRTEQATGAHPAMEETSLPLPQLTPASPESNKLMSYRETHATSLHGEEAAPSLFPLERAPSARTASHIPHPLEPSGSRTSHPVEMGVQEAESYRKRGCEFRPALSPARERAPAVTELSCTMVLVTKAIEDQGMEIGTESRGQPAAPTTEGMVPVDTKTIGVYTFPEALWTQPTNVTEVVGTKEAPSSSRKGPRGGISRLTPTRIPPAATESDLEPSKVTSTTGHLETQTISPTEMARMKIPFSQKRAYLTTKDINMPLQSLANGQFLEALTKTTTQAVLGLQEVQKSPNKQGRVSVMPSLETPKVPVTHPSTGTADTTSIGASLHDTSHVLSISTEVYVQEATSSHGPRKRGHPYAATPAGTWPVTRESEYRGHPTKETLVQEMQSIGTPGRRATETTFMQTRTQNFLNTEEGTPIADTATEVVHSTGVKLLLEAPENKTLVLRELTKEETSSYREEGGLSTTHPLISNTLSTETEQVQTTQVNEQMLPENWPTSRPEQGTGKPTTLSAQTGGEYTNLTSMGGVPSLEVETHWFDLAEGTSLQQASPHQTFTPIDLQIGTLSSQKTPAMILHQEEYGQTPTSIEGMQPAKTEVLEVQGLFTKSVSTQSPETPTSRLEVSVFHRKKGRGKPSLPSIDSVVPAEKETYLLASTKIALGTEALAGQTTSQTELGITEVSLAQLLGSPTPAERTSFPGAEATEAVNKVPSNSTETREPIPTARTPSAGTEVTRQSYSTTVKAAETPSSPSERRGYTATSVYKKKNAEQAYTHSPIGSMSSAGSDTTHTSPSLWPSYYQTALASTEPVKTQIESGAPSPIGGIPSGEVEPTHIGSSLETQTPSPPAVGNGGKYSSISREHVTPVSHWDLGNISAPERHSSLSEKWALNTTRLANDEQSTPQAQAPRERTTTLSAVGVMPTPGTKEAHDIKVTHLKRAFQKHPGDLFAVDPELLHLVGKRSLPDLWESPAPPHDSNPDLKVITLTHGDTQMQSPLLSNSLEKLRAKVLEAFQKKHILLPEFQVSPITRLYPAAKEIKSVPWLETTAPDHKHGLFRPKEHLFSDKKKTTSLTPFLLSAEAVLATAPPAMDKPIAAPLPKRQSSSGKRAHHILPAQRATVQPAWQVCDFEKDLCSWQQSDTDDFDWILAGERPSARSAIGGNLSEETHSPSSGGYISLKSPSARQTTGHKTSLISPILHRIGCIHFWYSPLGSVMGTINIYIKLADAPEWHRIWSAKGKQGRDWHQVGVETSVSQKLQVMVEGIIGPDAGSDVGIDDLSVCVAECQGGCDELIALYKK